MDLLSTPEAALKRTLLPTTPQYHQILHQIFVQSPVQHPQLLQQTDWKLYSRCRRLIHSANACLNNYSMRKHCNMKWIYLLNVRGLLYKHKTDSGQKFLALVIPKSWKYTVLVEAHNKLGHQGNTQTYCLIKRQYYLKGMNKDIWKYIANCMLCHREKAKFQNYPLQMMEIPNRPFDKIDIDLVIECETSTSGNKHILTIIDHLTGWPEAYPIPDKTADTIVSTFINEYLPVHMCP